jgi:hypothetical protein
MNTSLMGKYLENTPGENEATSARHEKQRSRRRTKRKLLSSKSGSNNDKNY